MKTSSTKSGGTINTVRLGHETELFPTGEMHESCSVIPVKSVTIDYTI